MIGYYSLVPATSEKLETGLSASGQAVWFLKTSNSSAARAATCDGSSVVRLAGSATTNEAPEPGDVDDPLAQVGDFARVEAACVWVGGDT